MKNGRRLGRSITAPARRCSSLVIESFHPLQTWNTPIGRWRALLVGMIVLGVFSFAVTATRATSEKRSSEHAAAAASAPAAPTGPRGPITLTCRPGGGAGVIGTAGPAGPQGPVGVELRADTDPLTRTAAVREPGPRAQDLA